MGVFFIQLIYFKWNSYPAILNRIASIIVGVFIFNQTAERFKDYYFNVMFWLSLVSLIFYSFTIVADKAINFFGDGIRYYSIGIYNHISYNGEFINRNSGPFWEPGAFAGYLLLIPLFFIDNLVQFWKINKFKVIILFVALLTTKSTSGYIVLFFIIGYLSFFKIRYKTVKFLIIPIVFCVSFYSYNNLEFLGDKILQQNLSANRVVSSGKYSAARIGSFMFDLHYIQKHPLFGNGLHSKTRYEDHPELQNRSLGHGNGFSNFIASMGLIFAFIYFYMIYMNLPFNRRDRIAFIIVLILLLQGEQYLNYPLFLGLPFIVLKLNNENCEIDGT